MLYRIRLTRTVAAKVVGLHPELKKRIKSALLEIAENPYAGKALQADLSGFYTFKLRRYRVIYKPNDIAREITVYMVGHRRDIYELLAEYLGKK